MRILTGYDAIAHAKNTGAQLQKNTDPTEEARKVSLEEAEQIAKEDEGLIWCNEEPSAAE